jgi:hypothetical protein
MPRCSQIRRKGASVDQLQTLRHLLRWTMSSTSVVITTQVKKQPPRSTRRASWLSEVRQRPPWKASLSGAYSTVGSNPTLRVGVRVRVILEVYLIAGFLVVLLGASSC